MTQTALSAMFPTATTTEGLTQTELASQRKFGRKKARSNPTQTLRPRLITSKRSERGADHQTRGEARDEQCAAARPSEVLDGVTEHRTLGTPHSPRWARARAFGRTGRTHRKAPQAAIGSTACEVAVAGCKGGGGECRT